MRGGSIVFKKTGQFSVKKFKHARLLTECALDLNKFDPTPPEIDNHINFTHKLIIELLKEYPDDKDIKELLKEENTKERCSTNWYEKFGYKYTNL